MNIRDDSAMTNSNRAGLSPDIEIAIVAPNINSIAIIILTITCVINTVSISSQQASTNAIRQHLERVEVSAEQVNDSR